MPSYSMVLNDILLVVYSTYDFQELYITSFSREKSYIVFFLIFHVKSKNTSMEYVAKGAILNVN